MQIEVEANLNCARSEQFVFQELESPKAIKGIRVSDRGKEIDCDVVGVAREGKFVQAYAAKIADSGAGFAYLIHGGDWGIRIRPAAYSGETWDFSNKHQWGEPFKIYGSTEDIIYT